MSLPPCTFIFGGAASGKSAFAETLCLQAETSLTYIATAQAFDAEMTAKIAEHQARRGAQWHTVEAPVDLGAALADVATDVVLIDCATLWLSNQMLAEADLISAIDSLLIALAACPARVVIVSNEVGQGIVPGTAMGREFRNAQGRLNQRLAAQAALVVQVIVGLPQVLKGSIE